MGAKQMMVFSHWNTMIEGLDASPKAFFEALEKAIEKRSVPNTKHSRVDYKEAGILSAKREYLRIRRKDHAFDICGAPFGNGFFVSWWLGEVPSGIWALISMIPFLGWIAERLFKPQTYYQVDTMMMFQSLIHAAALEVIDDMTKAKGLRALSEAERKPQMRDFFQR